MNQMLPRYQSLEQPDYLPRFTRNLPQGDPFTDRYNVICKSSGVVRLQTFCKAQLQQEYWICLQELREND